MSEAQRKAERELDQNHFAQTAGYGALAAGRCIGWALLAVADAIRDHADAVREGTAIDGEGD
jgi:hypothetical protein